MTEESQVAIEHEWIKDALTADVVILKTEINPTTDDDKHVRIDGRLGGEDDDDVAWAALPVIYVLGALSFEDARPRGYSEADFVKKDDWKAEVSARASFRGILTKSLELDPSASSSPSKAVTT